MPPSGTCWSATCPSGCAGGSRSRSRSATAPTSWCSDEPTSGVDPLQRARLWDTIRASAEGGAGVLVTTHHMSEAEQCDRLVVLASGRVAAEGTMDQVVDGTRAVEVRSDRWEEAFTALDAAGLPVSLVGRTLRVAGADPEAVGRLLAEAGVDAEVGMVPASFEEAFVVLATRAA